MMRAPEERSILVVDDSPGTVEVLHRNLSGLGHRVFTAPGVEEAIKVLESTPIDLVITDLKMPRVSGFDLIRHVRENLRDTEVIMITGYPTVEGAVKAVKLGADQYLAKPFTDEELAHAVGEAFEKLHVRRMMRVKEHRPPAAPQGLIGDSAAMKAIFSAITRSASSGANVLITGESGTGKELVARAIHYSSARNSSPFVPVNCAGIPEGLLESEMFGHMKGAFTGAAESRAGFFQTADGGSIFLDEIGDMSIPMQAKLLRVLQDREVTMVGSSRSQKVDVRIIAATNKNLLALIGKDLFREDLYFRLNVIPVELPPLRDREDDILTLVSHFAGKYANEFGRPAPRFSREALHVLRSYYWPGNVRELENVVQRLVVMTDSEVIEVPDLPSLMRFSALGKAEYTRTLAEMEKEYVRNVLASVNGNKSEAAKILDIDRRTLRDKLKP